jgi:phosphoribosylglycinamide formyltransferase 2
MFVNRKVMLLLGSGELGKEVAIEAQRLGVEVVAVDSYADAPAMQVAHRYYVINMLDPNELRRVVELERPDLIVPEVEAIATDELVRLEEEGFNVVPTARATWLTMNREGIRRLAREELGLPTADYRFAESLEELKQAVREIGLPCVIKPIMSSSGKGQSLIKSEEEIAPAWEYAQTAKRGGGVRVIVEEFIRFDSEITLLTVRTSSGTLFCPPIGHVQKDGDYIESWQPHGMTPEQLAQAQEIARKVTDALGGYGLFGVELFIAPDRIYFSEVSPRPHDTGMVTMASQDLSEFALHVRAILGFPIPGVRLLTPAASAVVKATEASDDYAFDGVEAALAHPNTQVRLFAKPVTRIGRRMGVVLSSADDVEEARRIAKEAAASIRITYRP